MDIETAIAENPRLISDYWIETASGRKLHFLQPKPEEICIEDIVVGCSRKPRYNGQCKHGKEWNVAVHQVLTWRIGVLAFDQKEENFDLMLGLLFHDAHEAYLPDIPSPVKVLLNFIGVSAIKELEGIIQEAVYEKYDANLSEEEVRKIKLCDKFALLIESEELMLSSGKNWRANDVFKESAEYHRHFKDLRVDFPLRDYTKTASENLYMQAIQRYIDINDICAEASQLDN